METLLIPNDFDGHRLASAMIAAMQYLSKRTFAQGVDHLVPICKMIAVNNQIVTSFIVVTVIIG